MINLIPLSYLNEACFLSLNVNPKKYQMLLKIAQDSFANLIGREFYEEIETQYDANTLSADNDAFYDPYVKDYLAWKTYFEYLGFSNSDETPTGTRKFKDDNSELLSDVELFARQRNVGTKVNFYKGELLSFLKLAQEKDSTKYPKYEQKCNEEFSFGITAVSKASNALFKVNKTITNNE